MDGEPVNVVHVHPHRRCSAVHRRHGANRQGLLALACSSPTLTRTKPSVDDSPALQDWLRELTNQLAGRIKNRFGRYRVPLHVGLPSATTGATGETDHQ